MNTRKSTAVLALTLAAGFGITACGGAEDAAKDAADKVSEAANPGLSDEEKQQLGDFVENFFKTARGAELPDEAPEDIKALLDKIDSADEIDDSEDMSAIAEVFDNSELSADEKQKVLDYFTDIDPVADMVDTDGMTEGEQFGVHFFNIVSGATFSILDESMLGSIDVNTEKVEFGDNTAKTTADSFEAAADAEASGASSDPSSTASAESDSSSSSMSEAAGIEMAKQYFDGVSFVFEDGSWKIDGKSYLAHIDNLAQEGSSGS